MNNLLTLTQHYSTFKAEGYAICWSRTGVHRSTWSETDPLRFVSHSSDSVWGSLHGLESGWEAAERPDNYPVVET